MAASGLRVFRLLLLPLLVLLLPPLSMSALLCHSEGGAERCLFSCFYDITYDNVEGAVVAESRGCGSLMCLMTKADQCRSVKDSQNCFTYRFCCCDSEFCNDNWLVSKHSGNASPNVSFNEEYRVAEKECSFVEIAKSYALWFLK